MISDVAFNQLKDLWGNPEVDLFASRLNKKLEKYVSWEPVPELFAMDSFSVTRVAILVKLFHLLA